MLCWSSRRRRAGTPCSSAASRSLPWVSRARPPSLPQRRRGARSEANETSAAVPPNDTDPRIDPTATGAVVVLTTSGVRHRSSRHARLPMSEPDEGGPLHRHQTADRAVESALHNRHKGHLDEERCLTPLGRQRRATCSRPHRRTIPGPGRSGRRTRAATTETPVTNSPNVSGRSRRQGLGLRTGCRRCAWRRCACGRAR